jgi:hypothetical protein
MKPTNVTGYPFSNGDRLTAVSVNQICNALDAIQDYNDTIKEFEDLVEENTEEIKSEINRVAYDDVSVNGIAGEIGAGKAAIAEAINAKGGSASATESFNELAEDIVNLNKSFITYGVEVTEKIHWLNFICNAGIPTRLPLTAIDDDTVTEISQPNVFQNCTALERVKMTALTTISGGNVFQSCSSLQRVELPNLTTISGSHVFQSCSALQEFNAPNLTSIINDNFYQSNALRCMILGTLTYLASNWMGGSLRPNLRNITIGSDTNISLPFQNWTAANVIAEGQSGIDELNSNLYNNLLTKLYDHSQDGQTRTLRIGWLANVTAENIAYANAKGWTLTT